MNQNNRIDNLDPNFPTKIGSMQVKYLKIIILNCPKKLWQINTTVLKYILQNKQELNKIGKFHHLKT